MAGRSQFILRLIAAMIAAASSSIALPTEPILVSSATPSRKNQKSLGTVKCRNTLQRDYFFQSAIEQLIDLIALHVDGVNIACSIFLLNHYPERIMKNVFATLSAAAILALAANAQAVPTPYSPAGTPNGVTYTFTAAATGNLIAYFAGSSASYTNEITMLVNGVATGIQGLNNHTSNYGDQLNFGSVNAGDTLVFELLNISPGGIGPWYSQQSMNYDRVNHVYSAAYGGDIVIPAGTFVAFEDLPFGGDFNYQDENFVFTNVATSTNVPEPASLALFGLGIGGIALSRRKRAISSRL